MPKRSYPFEGVSPLQLKTHVGEKELCQGVCGDRYKREIFEKTKKLLFNGAKTVMGNLEHQSEKGQEEDNTAHELLTGQTTIGQDGKLQRKTQALKKLPTGVSKACSSCVRSVGDKEACSQCDRYTCKNCCKQCSCCSAITCSFCTVVVDRDQGERVFCSSCSVFEL
ncbi:apoptosis regulatory protein Siva [Rhinophrynus dorsalis]